jgi:chromosome segregation and condensation protein ScpB
MGVLCAVAYHQPVSRVQLAEIFGHEISRDILNRLRSMELITNGPKSPRLCAPHTFVTTPMFLVTFDLQSLRDLPELYDLMD